MSGGRRATGVHVRGSASGPLPKFIEITAVPPGEAPLEVRRAWVGVRLPLAVDGLQELETMGVVSGQRWRFAKWLARRLGKYEMMQGYLVDARIAIEALSKTAPDAADWWRRHTPEAAANTGHHVMFPALVARLIPHERAAPANQP